MTKRSKKISTVNVLVCHRQQGNKAKSKLLKKAVTQNPLHETPTSFFGSSLVSLTLCLLYKKLTVGAKVAEQHLNHFEAFFALYIPRNRHDVFQKVIDRLDYTIMA